MHAARSTACMLCFCATLQSIQQAARTRRSSSLVSSDKLVTRTLFSSRLLFMLSPVSPAARFLMLGGTYPPVFAPAAGKLLMPPGVPSCMHIHLDSCQAKSVHYSMTQMNCFARASADRCQKADKGSSLGPLVWQQFAENCKASSSSSSSLVMQRWTSMHGCNEHKHNTSSGALSGAGPSPLAAANCLSIRLL